MKIKQSALELKEQISNFSIQNSSPGLAKKIERLQEKTTVTNARIQSLCEIKKFSEYSSPKSSPSRP